MALSTGSQRWLLALALSAGALGAALAAALALSTWPWHLSMALSAGLLAVTSSQSAAGTGMAWGQQCESKWGCVLRTDTELCESSLSASLTVVGLSYHAKRYI